MPKVTFLPSGKTSDAKTGSLLIDVARLAGVEFEAPCGGKGTCGKCIVRITEGEVQTEVYGVLSGRQVRENYVPSCKSVLKDCDITVEVPAQLISANGKFANDSDGTSLVRHELLPHKWQHDPLTIKWYLEVPPPRPEDGMSDLDRLTRCFQKDWGKNEVVYPLSVIRNLSETLRKDNGKVSVLMVRETGKNHIIDIEPGNNTTKYYGVAIDIGTTTLAVELVYLPEARVVSYRTGYNDQIACGLDVISRIDYAKKPGHLEELRSRVLGTINRLLGILTEGQHISPNDICNAVIAGNTTMVHLLLGLDPEYIRLEPYTPTVLDVPFLTAADVGIAINPNSWLYISPSVGSYIGGDITAGILCTDLSTDSEDINLFIDIGTNGEIVLGNRDFLMCCACSAGPAFEGGGMEFGMRASMGAVEAVEIDENNGKAVCQVIGNTRPKGICGSGMISLLANLFLTGWIDAAGKLNRSGKSPFIVTEGRNAYYVIVPGNESENGKPIVIREQDIENIIRAKAAIYSAYSLMLKKLDLTYDSISTIYIAGGFGRFLNLEMAKIIGLIPDLPAEKFKYIGNSSLTGAFMVLISQDYREKQAEMAKKMTYIDIGSVPEYMDQYTAALFLPHTDISLFPSIKAMYAENNRIKP